MGLLGPHKMCADVKLNKTLATDVIQTLHGNKTTQSLDRSMIDQCQSSLRIETLMYEIKWSIMKFLARKVCKVGSSHNVFLGKLTKIFAKGCYGGDEITFYGNTSRIPFLQWKE